MLWCSDGLGKGEWFGNNSVCTCRPLLWPLVASSLLVKSELQNCVSVHIYLTFIAVRICLRITRFFLSTQELDCLVNFITECPHIWNMRKWVIFYTLTLLRFWLNVRYMLMLLQWLYHVKLFLNIKLLLLIISSMLNRFLKYRIVKGINFVHPFSLLIFSNLIISSFKEYLILLFSAINLNIHFSLF